MPKLGTFLFAAAVGFSTFVYAESDLDFESTVKELKSSLKDDIAPVRTRDTDSPQVEFGAALIGGYLTVGDYGAPSGGAMVNGFDLHTGVDLYSSHWVAEGAYRSFGTETFAKNYSASLSEFDLLLVHKSDLQKSILLRIGGGFSASYLKTMDNRNGYQEGTDQAPGIVALLGVEKVFSPKVSVGPDLDFHAPLLQQTVQRSSVDASVRLNFHF